MVSDSFATPWTVTRQAPLSMEFSRQEHWSGLPCPSPGDLPNLEIKPRSPTLQADSLPTKPSKKPMKLQDLWPFFLLCFLLSSCQKVNRASRPCEEIMEKKSWKKNNVSSTSWFCSSGLACRRLFFLKLIHSFIFNFWLHWVFDAMQGLSLVAESKGYSSLRCAGFSWWLLLLQSTGCRVREL